MKKYSGSNGFTPSERTSFPHLKITRQIALNDKKVPSNNIISSLTGFTLIEIMVVLIIIGVLALLIAPRLFNRLNDARVMDAKVQIRNFETALRLFKADNGFYPSAEQGLEALISPPAAGRVPEHYRTGGYLEKKELPADPWGNEYIYVSPGIKGDYDIITYGADGQYGGKGYNTDISNWDI